MRQSSERSSKSRAPCRCGARRTPSGSQAVGDSNRPRAPATDHCDLRLVRKLQQVEIGVGHHHVVSADPSLSIAKRRDLRHGPPLSETRGINSESGRQRLGSGRIVRLGASPCIEADLAKVHGPDSRSRRASDHARIPSQAARAGAALAAVDFAVTHFFASPSALPAKHRRRLAVQRVGNSGPAPPVKWGSSRP